MKRFISTIFVFFVFFVSFGVSGILFSQTEKKIKAENLPTKSPSKATKKEIKEKSPNNVETKDTETKKEPPKPEIPSTEKPVVKIEDGIVYITPKSRIEIKAESNDIAYIEYKVNNSKYFIYNAPISLPGEGVYIISYRGIDKLKNIEKEKILKVIVDNTPPKVFVSYNTTPFYYEGKLYISKNTKIYLLGRDNLSRVEKIEYSFDGKNFKEYKSHILPPNSGKITLYYRAVDIVGNASKIDSVELYVDSSSPKASIKLPLPYAREGENTIRITSYHPIVIEGIDSGSGIKKLFYKINNSDFIEYKKPFFLKEGRYKISVKAVDNVGNESSVISYDILVDDNPPKTNIEFE